MGIPKKAKFSEVKIEVDKQKSEYESRLFGQKERIFSLREENQRLKAELEYYHKKDSQISSALILAIQKAKEIEDTQKLKSELEILKLKEFHNKWVRYYDEVRKLFPKDEKVASAGVFLKKMEKILGSTARCVEDSSRQEELALSRQMENSKKRIATMVTESQKVELAMTEETKSNMDKVENVTQAEVEEDIFRMEDVLNPKNLASLDELCKELGLNS